MEEQTITEATTEQTGAETALPVQGEQTSAAPVTSEEQGETSQGEQTGSLPEVDEKLKSFAKGQGIEDLSDLTDREKSLLKAAYDNQAEYQRTRQKATELEKTMSTMSDESATQAAEATGQDPEVLKRLQRMEVKSSIHDFWETHPDARQYEKEMAKIAVESGIFGSPEAILQASYAMAIANHTDSVKSQGKREALESLAHKQQAAVPTGHATNSGVTPKEKPFEELSIAEMEAKLGFVRR